MLNKNLGIEIPKIIVKILEESGFNCKATLILLNADSIVEIENYVNENRAILVGTNYETIFPFKLLPGHRMLLRNIPQYVEQLKNSEGKSEPNMDTSQYPYMLKCLIETAESNANKSKKGHRYNDTIRYLAIYVYQMCGKSLYEMLSANLPIPAPSTIHTFIYHILFFNVQQIVS